MQKMKNILIKTLTFLLVFFSLSSVHADDYTFDIDKVFNQNLTQSERQELLQGKIVIRKLSNCSEISLNPSENSLNLFLNKFINLKPTYIAEIVRIIPVKENEDLISKIQSILTDIPSYKGIPYYSERNEYWVDLYSEAKILSQSSDNSGIYAESNLKSYFYMKPFGDIFSDIKVLNNKEMLFYENINAEDIKYDNFTCIKKQKMISSIYVFKSDDYWILYGIGGANAPRIPFLNKRIEVSFINRIKTFCNYVFSKLGSV